MSQTEPARPARLDPLPAPEALLFDLDGTLVDTVGTRAAAWLATFAESGIPADRDAVAPLMGADGRWVASEVARWAGLTPTAAELEAIDHRAGQIFDDLNHDPLPLPGAQALLADLDRMGFPWAIATSSGREQVRASLEALRLGHEPRVTDGHHVTRAKPAPDLLLEAARELGFEPALCWYIGDSRWDMQAARAAGMVAIGIATGAIGEPELAAEGAHRTFTSLALFGDELVRPWARIPTPRPPAP